MTLPAGTEPPHVTAPDQFGEEMTLDYDSPTVLFFYPEDGTPGCTEQARQFNRELESYREAGVKPVGVSTNTVEDHRDFADELGLEFPILADPTGSIAEQFDVTLENRRANRTTVVVVDEEIYRVYTEVDPDGHARDVLLDLLDDGVVELPPP